MMSSNNDSTASEIRRSSLEISAGTDAIENGEEGLITQKGNSICDRMLKQLSSFASYIKHNPCAVALSAIEAIVLSAVFIVTFFYDQKNESVTLVAADKCNLCHGSCESQTVLNAQQNSYSSRASLTFVAPNHTYYYGWLYYFASWYCDQVSNPTFLGGSSGSKVTYFTIPLSTQKQDTSKQVTKCLPYWCCQILPQMLVLQVLLMNYIVTLCIITDQVETNGSNLKLKVIVPSDNFMLANSSAEIVGVVQAGGSTVTASCSLSISGIIIPFYSASNAIVISETSQCTSYPSALSSIGTSLSYTLTALAVIKALWYFKNWHK